jgi:hypothetical protein
VSTREQDLAAQDAELRNAGCVKTFKEKVSGAKTIFVNFQGQLLVVGRATDVG